MYIYVCVYVGTLFNVFYETNIFLTPKYCRPTRPISLMNTDKTNP